MLLPELDWVSLEEGLLIFLHMAGLKVWSWGQQHHPRASQIRKCSGSAPDPPTQSTEDSAHKPKGSDALTFASPAFRRLRKRTPPSTACKCPVVTPLLGSWASSSFPSNSKRLVLDVLPDSPSQTHAVLLESTFLKTGLQDTGVHVQTQGEVPVGL